MTTLTFFLSYYLAGIACLMWLDSTDHLNLAGMVKAARDVRRTPKIVAAALPAMWHVPAPAGETAELTIAARLFYLPRDGEYVGRHWAKARPDDLEQLAEAFTDVIDLTHTVVGHRRTRRQPAWNGPTGSCFLPEGNSDVGPYAPKAGVAAYVHLRQDELDALAERDARRLKPHAPVDLKALRLRTSTMPMEHDDGWAAV